MTTSRALFAMNKTNHSRTISEKSPSIRLILLEIWKFLGRKRKIQTILLLLLMLASGFAELISLGSLLPFLAVLSNPDEIWNSSRIGYLAEMFGISSTDHLILLCVVFFVTAVALSALIRLLNLWLNGRLAAQIGSDLSCEAFKRTLYQPYSVHIQRNSSEVIAALTTLIGKTVAALSSLLQLITSLIVSVALFTGLFLINKAGAVVACMSFGSIYYFLGIMANTRLRSNSKIIARSAANQVRALNEGLGAIRNVLIEKNQPFYIDRYVRADRPQRLLGAQNNFIGAFPKITLEAFGLVSISVIGGSLILSGVSNAVVLPLLGVIALGAQRLLPSLQQIYSSWTILKGNYSDLLGVLEMLKQPMPPILNNETILPSKLVYNQIVFENVSYRYKIESPFAVNKLNLKINKGDVVGFVGSTGSGKTTVIDLLMGLLVPDDGEILLDGINLHKSENIQYLYAWQSMISHVPQEIFLTDNSIAENIAFGIPRSEIDIQRVKKASQMSQLSSFIESLPNGYENFVGERGVNLSGGQRQRIGIARALYMNSEVLIFDEGTSSLDTETEKLVMESINSLPKDITVIMIAHRLSTLSKCNKIIELSAGFVKQISCVSDLSDH